MPDVTASYGTLLDSMAFLSILIHSWRPFMSEVLIFHQIFTDCVSNQPFWYVDMPDVTTNYGRFSSLIGFYGNLNVWYVILHQTFINFVESQWK